MTISKKRRICPKCKIEKTISDFHSDTKRKDKLQLWCKKCMTKNKFDRYYAGKKPLFQLAARKSALKRQYGITIEEYDDILLNQNGVCAICRLPESQRSNPRGAIDSLRVDHNHTTGRIRGLLCSKCNFGLGHLNDDIRLLERAIEYLNKNDKDN